MTKVKFAPKDAETLKTEITTELGIDYEGNEEMVDKLVNRGLKDEQFKASLHEEKTNHLKGKEWYKQQMVKAGFDPKTGERVNKPNGSGDTTPKNDGYSLGDIRALQDVHDEDVDEIVEYAKFKKISIAEAKKSPVIQNSLKIKAEERATALAAATGAGRHGTQKTSSESLLEKANQGQLPEKPEDMQQLAEARLEEKRNRNKR